MKQAVIDIGSNSVRLMLRADGKTLYKKVCTTRLGEGIARAPFLNGSAMERTARAVEEFAEEGRAQGASVFAFATAAVRAAENREAFLALVRARCGLEVDVVSGEEEAALGLCGALGHGDGCIIDIGGASTELACRRGGTIALSLSLPVGAVRLYDRCADDPDRLREEIGRAIAPVAGSGIVPPVYAIGGTASTLASVKLGLRAYDGAALNGLVLSAPWLREEAERLLSLSAEERKGVAGMDARRADIIAGGALLLSMLAEELGLPEVLFSDSDNLEGYLYARGLL